MPEPESKHVDAKIYAPFLVKLEADFPLLAPLLIGIGDAPCDYDVKKTTVSAHFQTEAGSRFSGRYITQAATSSEDAVAFLAAMVKKWNAVNATDRKILGAQPAPAPAPAPLAPSPPPPPRETGPVPELLEDEDEEDEDPEPVTESETGDEDWGKPAQ